jgi:hypothetical protein
MKVQPLILWLTVSRLLLRQLALTPTFAGFSARRLLLLLLLKLLSAESAEAPFHDPQHVVGSPAAIFAEWQYEQVISTGELGSSMRTGSVWPLPCHSR